MDLRNKKVYVDGRSAEIQKKAFELGFRWRCGKQEVRNTRNPFLYFSENYSMWYGDNMEYFKSYGFDEITAYEILAIPTEPKFKPFDRVLVRDLDSQEWRASLYSHYNENLEYPHVMVESVYMQCIPYEGNEHLVGTSNKP